MKIVGMEVHDLLFVLLTASVMNLVFGRTFLALYLVFLLPSVMAAVLFFAKRNQPERYLIHLLRYVTSPGFYSAGETGPSERAARITGLPESRESRVNHL